jgi:hypothetical protein
MADATTVSDGASSYVPAGLTSEDPHQDGDAQPADDSDAVEGTIDSAAGAVAEPPASEHSADQRPASPEANVLNSIDELNGFSSNDAAATAHEPAHEADAGLPQVEAAPGPVAAPAEEDEDSFSDEPDESSFPTARRTTRDSIHIYRDHLGAPAARALGTVSSASASAAAAAAAANAVMAAKKAPSAQGGGDDGGGSGGGGGGGGVADDPVVERMSLADVVEAVAPSALSKRPAPPALPNEVQFEVTYFTASLGLRLK